jgi:hypothetical protein
VTHTTFDILDDPMQEFIITNEVSTDLWCIAHEAGERGAEYRILRRPPEYPVLAGSLPRPSRALRWVGPPTVWADGRCPICRRVSGDVEWCPRCGLIVTCSACAPRASRPRSAAAADRKEDFAGAAGA